MELKHKTNHWYTFGAVFPFLSVIVCWIFYYSLGHYDKGVIRTISETVCPFPESRIFGVTMNIEAFILFIFYLIRNKIVSTMVLETNYVHSRGFIVKKTVMKVCTACVPIGLSALSALTLDEHQFIHLTGAFFFFYGSIIYYIVSDSALKSIGYSPSLFQRCVSYSTLVFSLLYMGLLSSSNGNRKIANSGAIFQYFTALSIFFKIYLFQYEMPQHYFVTTKRST